MIDLGTAMIKALHGWNTVTFPDGEEIVTLSYTRAFRMISTWFFEHTPDKAEGVGLVRRYAVVGDEEYLVSIETVQTIGGMI